MSERGCVLFWCGALSFLAAGLSGYSNVLNAPQHKELLLVALFLAIATLEVLSATLLALAVTLREK